MTQIIQIPVLESVVPVVQVVVAAPPPPPPAPVAASQDVAVAAPPSPSTTPVAANQEAAPSAPVKADNSAVADPAGGNSEKEEDKPKAGTSNGQAGSKPVKKDKAGETETAPGDVVQVVVANTTIQKPVNQIVEANVPPTRTLVCK